jgi:heme O synthase-like polyprenyltransferase
MNVKIRVLNGMGIIKSIKDHLMIGGPNAIAGWGSLILFTISGGVLIGRVIADLNVFLPILLAAALTGNGIYALNAYYDIETDRIDKPGRPLPSGRMTPQHALASYIILWRKRGSEKIEFRHAS